MKFGGSKQDEVNVGNKHQELLDKLSAREGGERKTYTLSLNSNYYNKLQSICEMRKIKISHLIDELIIDFIDNIDEAKAARPKK